MESGSTVVWGNWGRRRGKKGEEDKPSRCIRLLPTSWTLLLHDREISFVGFMMMPR
jgi:hypothetical protein